MARVPFRRTGPVGLFLLGWDIWRRIPPRHRRRIAQEARRHAPTVARAVARRARAVRSARPKS